jgi:hypothetical protein
MRFRVLGEWLQAHGIAAFILKYRLADMGQTEEELQKNAQDMIQPMITIANSSNREEELQKYPKAASVIKLAVEDGRQAIKYIRSNAAKYKINQEHIGLMGKALSFMCIQKVAMGLECINEVCPLIIGLSSLESG